MEYRTPPVSEAKLRIQPRLIIHGGAGNIQRSNFPPEKYAAYRDALLSIVTKTQTFMNSSPSSYNEKIKNHPSALDIATHAVVLLEDNPLFNSGHGAVFTRDGVNELEASVMVSRGLKKRGVGVMGLRRVRNPILLAQRMLERGEEDLAPAGDDDDDVTGHVKGNDDLDVPSAQGHTQLHGPTAEKLATNYGLALVDPSYFFTQQRWDEHIRALEREKSGISSSATWHADEYLPQGTCGAVALDAEGVICAATSTGGMTNKLTGRIGDTPVVGAGFWAEEWDEDVEADVVLRAEPGISFAGPLKGLLADCFPTPWMHSPSFEPLRSTATSKTRSVGFSGTGNGDSFLRVNAVRTVAAIARYRPCPGSLALAKVAGPGGQLQQSAGDRWGRTGEGEGGIIGLECVLERDEDGRVVGVRSEVLMRYNCGGMYRAWIDDEGKPVMSIWSNGSADEL
ncbi:N-terminal nucleophile aminohydrolase [Trichoderma aethiopicum]